MYSTEQFVRLLWEIVIVSVSQISPHGNGCKCIDSWKLLWSTSLSSTRFIPFIIAFDRITPECQLLSMTTSPTCITLTLIYTMVDYLYISSWERRGKLFTFSKKPNPQYFVPPNAIQFYFVLFCIHRYYNYISPRS